MSKDKSRSQFMFLDELVRHPKNKKKHNLDLITKSIESKGYQDFINIYHSPELGNNIVIDGNGTHEAIFEMFETDPDNPPKFITLKDDRWYLEVQVGEFDSDDAALAYLYDVNNIPLMVDDYSDRDSLFLYEPNLTDDLTLLYENNSMPVSMIDINPLELDMNNLMSNTQPLDYSSKNKEIDVSQFSDEITLVLRFNIEDHDFVKSSLFAISDNLEEALVTALKEYNG